MSHVIHLWNESTPAAWAQAVAIFQDMGAPGASPQARFAGLARRMRSAWLAVGDEWTVEAPRGAVDRAVWSLALAVPSMASTTPDHQPSAR